MITSLSFVGPANKGYVQIDFLDKKGRKMMSSVDVVLNSCISQTAEMIGTMTNFADLLKLVEVFCIIDT